jgi:hypothetical protein
MELLCEGPAPNRASNDAVVMDTGIGIFDDPEILLATNQTSLESDVPPLELPHPISLINFMVSQMPSSAHSPLTMPSTSTATTRTITTGISSGARGMDATETTITGESSEEAAAWQLISIQNVNYECNETGIALSVPVATAQLTFNARDSYGHGYDSDGELGPFYDAVFDEPSESKEEEELASNVPLTNVPTPAVPNDSEHAEPSPTLDEDTVKRLTISQLKDELRKQKLTVNGVKLVLQNRLLAFFSNPSSKYLPGETPAAKVQNASR